MPELSSTQKLEDFLDNNQPGGYINTTINISSSNLNETIDNILSTKNLLTSTSHINWNNIDNKPIIPTISINNTLNSGTKIATLTINGSSTDIYMSSAAEETDPIFSNHIASQITPADIQSWNNKSNFDGSYTSLTNIPSPITYNLDASSNNSDISGLANVAISGDYSDLTNTFTTINFGDFIYRYHNNEWTTFDNNDPTTQQEYNIMKNCGSVTGYVKNINELYDSDDNTTNISLIDRLAVVYTEFNEGKICYIKLSDDEYHLITDFTPVYDNQQIIGYSLFSVQLNYSNYFTDLASRTTTTDTQIEDILMRINLLSGEATIIIDLNKNILFSLFKQTYPVMSNNESIYVDPDYNGINVQISPRANNKIQLIATLGEEGLYVS